MKRKFILIFSGFLFLFSSLFPSASYATFPCSLTTNPSSNLTTDNKSIKITVDGGQNLPDGRYKIEISASGTNNFLDAQTSGGKASAVYSGLSSFAGQAGTIYTFPSGIINVNLYQGQSPLCSNSLSFTVSKSASADPGGGCQINFVNTGFTPSDIIETHITGALATNTNIDELYVSIISNDTNQEILGSSIKRADFVNDWKSTRLPTGLYTVMVQNNPLLGGRDTYCTRGFSIALSGGGPLGSGTINSQPPGTPCLVPGPNGTCATIATAIGKIGTDPLSLVTFLFGFILALSGGIALLLIIISGYRILVSQGNPEALKGAREQLTAAIVGLLFIILSVAVLQIIGISVLRIPGFG